MMQCVWRIGMFAEDRRRRVFAALPRTESAELNCKEHDVAFDSGTPRAESGDRSMPPRAKHSALAQSNLAAFSERQMPRPNR